ncbi:MAG: superoxide dismutase [Candidatus Bathyarchaeia archaeon]
MAKKYVLPDLPYKYNALEPAISEEIMRLHHDKHHAAYVNGANGALEKLEKGRAVGLKDVDVKAIVRDLAFNASGHVLHSLFWTNMSPKAGGKPGGNLGDQINKDFGSFDSFKLQLSNAAKTVEGSGWGILAYDPLSEQLLTLQTEKHQNLTVQGSIPLLVLDVWEHAYYLQYKNDRGAFVDKLWDVVSWSDVEARFDKAKR